MSVQNFTTPSPSEDHTTLNKRMEAISWALFLIMVGGIGLVPDKYVPEDTWLIGVGLIMLGLNAARYYYGIRMSSGTIFLGVLALLAGIGGFFGLDLPIFAVALILIGLSEFSKAFFEQKIE